MYVNVYKLIDVMYFFFVALSSFIQPCVCVCVCVCGCGCVYVRVYVWFNFIDNLVTSRLHNDAWLCFTFWSYLHVAAVHLQLPRNVSLY